ncbi:hypothetical protein ALC57_00920 [Trachymyrmex cornetzi]|uniref:Uncharacterized protein n=1 Tax=Trachymyrmex cornetzi TaxID=471704 RepID=A0A195EP34_9HYME|nr:hypothetical protein ALC57_00920 [Trachymyrmex cornetzi]
MNSPYRGIICIVQARCASLVLSIYTSNNISCAFHNESRRVPTTTTMTMTATATTRTRTRTKKRSSDAEDEEKAAVSDIEREGEEEGPKGIVTHAPPC